MKNITDSRAHCAIQTKTDHRMVIMTSRGIDPQPHRRNQTKKENINFENLRDPENQEKYKKAVEEHFNTNTPEGQQQKWDHIVKANHEAAKQVLGKKTNKTKGSNPEIRELSEQQKELNTKINSNIPAEKRIELRKERSKILTEIHGKLEQERTAQIREEIEDLERNQNDATKMFQAVRLLQKKDKPKPLLIETENGITNNEEKQVEEITKYFKEVFSLNDVQDILDVEPAPMKTPFSKQCNKETEKMKNHHA